MNQISLPPLFYVLRHGHTDWNDEGLLMGQQDIPLNIKGRDRARRASKLLGNVKIGTILSSPLKRARETAEIVAGEIEAPLHILEGLKEAHFGAWEGEEKSSDNLLKWQKKEVTQPGCESYADFTRRVFQALSLSDIHTHPVLWVTHGTVLELLFAMTDFDQARLGDVSTKGRPFVFAKGLDGQWRVELLG